MHELEELDQDGKKTGRKLLLLPRYHQLDAVRRLVAHARQHGPGQRYLVEHSAGSGKSNSIAWLAHQLSVLYGPDDQKVFDSVVVTDRKVLDRQLQKTVAQFEQMEGVVENIDKKSIQLKEALEAGKKIVVTTLQKFPVIVSQIQALPGKRFAVVVDEEHSSQTGESTKSLKAVLGAGDLEQAAAAEAGEPETWEDRIAADAAARQQPANVSTFAFTATPKPKTLELFGVKREDGKFEAFSLYSMRQAIEEGFILDVLEHYTTYKTYWKLLKKAADDPHYDKAKANYLLRSFVDLHPHAIRKKIEIMVDHFHEHVAGQIGGKAKAMIVARSRLHAVRYKHELNAYLKDTGHPYKTLVAFSGKVRDAGIEYTEAGMNGLAEVKTAATFRKPAYRFLVVAEKFQTGFDEPLLHAMYVDRKLAGVHAVQTLSRLNRTHPGKGEPLVLDFANEAEEIRNAFELYYEKTLLSEATDPNQLYDLENRLLGFHVFNEAEVEAFAQVYFQPKAKQDQIYALLAPLEERFEALGEDERAEFRGLLADYVRLYAFLSQIITFEDLDLEKLYVLARLLRRRLKGEERSLPKEIVGKIDIDSYRLQRTHKGKIQLERGQKEVPPILPKAGHGVPVEALEPLSEIIRELNERFGAGLTEQDKVVIQAIEDRLAADEALQASVRVNPPETARLAFEQVVTDRLQDLVDTNFKFYKRFSDDGEFAKFLLDWLFRRFREQMGGPAAPQGNPDRR